MKNGQTSVVLRVKLRDSSVTTGAGLTGLTSASSGLIISTIADNEASATAYTVAASKVESITTLGTYAAPTATKVRFKEVDATNHPGLYEIQVADARFAVASAKSLTISFSGATNLAQCDVVIPLRVVDPYAVGLGASADAIVYGTVAASPSPSNTTATLVVDIVPTVSDQFKGRILIFTRNTTTAALRGQATNITASTAPGSSSVGLTFTSLTTAPASTDTAVIV